MRISGVVYCYAEDETILTLIFQYVKDQYLTVLKARMMHNVDERITSFYRLYHLFSELKPFLRNVQKINLLYHDIILQRDSSSGLT